MPYLDGTLEPGRLIAGGYIIPTAEVKLLYFKVGPKVEDGMKIRNIGNQNPTRNMMDCSAWTF